MGAGELALVGVGEAKVKYHSCTMLFLMASRKPVARQGQAGSLTGAVASQRVTEARDGRLRPVGNRL